MADWPFAPLRPLNYDIIMADPPWKFRLWSKKGEKKSPEAQYSTMSIDDICKLPVGQLGTRDCLLWLWATWPTLLDCGDPGRRVPSRPSHSWPGQVMEAWGFRYVTGGVWLKRTTRGKPAFGTGYRLRSACEPFLIGVMGNPFTTRKERNLIEGVRRQHSRKPEEAYQFIERWAPEAMNRVELFSRSARLGWDGWGDEQTKFDTINPKMTSIGEGVPA